MKSSGPASVPQTSIHVRRAVEGDRESLEWVTAHLSPLVEAQVRFRLGSLARNAADVEDLAAEVWTVALRKLPRLRPREGHYAPVLAKYLGTTASHLCNNFLRRAVRRKTASLEGPDASTEDSSPGADAFALETRSIVTRIFHHEVTDMIRQALDELGEDKRQVLVLRMLEHKSNQEIAVLLDLKPNTVAVRYRRALEDLRNSLPPAVFSDMWTFRSAPA